MPTRGCSLKYWCSLSTRCFCCGWCIILYCGGCGAQGHIKIYSLLWDMMNMIMLWSHEERCKCAYKCNDVGTLKPLIDFFFFDVAIWSCSFIIPVQFIVRKSVRNGCFYFYSIDFVYVWHCVLLWKYIYYSFKNPARRLTFKYIYFPESSTLQLFC